MHPLPRAYTHMTRGQDGSLLLFLYDSFIHYFTPVYPDAIQTEGPRHELQSALAAK